MGQAVGGSKAVKSAGRALEVLEYLNTQNNEAGMVDIVRNLGYPKSSASELLHYLTDLGYLTCDPRSRKFRLTARAAVLGASVMPTLFRHGHLLELMDDISKATGELVAIAMRVGMHARLIHVVQATNPGRMFITPSYHVSLLKTAVGQLLLAAMPDQKLRLLLRRLIAEAPAQDRVALATVVARLEQIRADGYAVTTDTAVRGKGMVAVPLPDQDGQKMVLGIGGPSEIILGNFRRFAQILNLAVATRLSAAGTELAPDLAGLSLPATGLGLHQTVDRITRLPHLKHQPQPKAAYP